jgi:hypothetical protein
VILVRVVRVIGDDSQFGFWQLSVCFEDSHCGLKTAGTAMNAESANGARMNNALVPRLFRDLRGDSQFGFWQLSVCFRILTAVGKLPERQMDAESANKARMDEEMTLR